MSEGVDALAMARFWHRKWRDALEQKRFELAEEYFRTANEWKQKADVHGMLDQVNFDEDDKRGAA